jgi:hypothetical protein
MNPATAEKLALGCAFSFIICLLFLLATITHPKNREIYPDEYDDVIKHPYMVEYIKKHGLMKDGILTQWELESIPKPNPAKQTLLEMNR